jgi:tRNA A-37 threonylcarbamoyl transferase component Bud32
MSDPRSKIKVTDPFFAAQDAQLPTVALALDPPMVKEEFSRGLPRLSGPEGRVIVRSITVVRHKPGRRCVIDYDVRLESPDQPRRKAMLVGKIRARRFGNEGNRLQDAIWAAGFQADSPDGVSVPEAIGVIPQFQMWLQRKVHGTVATLLLSKADGVELVSRIAEAINKLHRAGVPTDRSHAMADELKILHECLPRVAEQKCSWAPRIARILNACDALGSTVPAVKPCGIHRDFYPAQVIVHRKRLCLIDFDLYCLGDPALDIGNFIGHITEQSLREFGKPDALRDREEAMENRFIELAGEVSRPGVRAYTTLTLVRHIYLSTQFAERTAFTEPLMRLCERRLGLE